MYSALRGLIAGAAGFAVGGYVFTILDGMTRGVRAASCGIVAAIVALAVFMALPSGKDASSDDSRGSP